MAEPLDPKMPIFAGDGARWTYVAGVFAVVFFALTIAAVAVVLVVARGPAGGGVVTALAFLWGVGAPAWFWFEYFYLYRKYGKPDTLELYKHGHKVSVAIWAGLALSLAALASSDVFKTPESPSHCISKATTAEHSR